MAKNFFDDTPDVPVEPQQVQPQPPLLPPSQPPVQPTPVTPPNVFSDPVPEKPRAPPEMRSYTPSPSENIAYAGQDLLTSLGAKPYQALELSKGIRNSAMLFPPIGAGVSALDAVHDFKKGSWMGGILNTIGALPGGVFAKSVARGQKAREVHPGFVDETNARIVGRRPEAPSSTALEESGVRQMDEFRDSGQIYPPSAASDVVRDARREMASAGHYPGATPVASEALGVLEKKAKNNPLITAPDMDELRRGLSNAIAAKEPGGHVARGVLFKKLEDTGDEKLKKGVADYAAGSRGAIVDEILTNAQRRTDPAKALENTLRSTVESEKKTRGFRDEEVAALDAARKGPLAARALDASADLLTGRGVEGAIRRAAPVSAVTAGLGSLMLPEARGVGAGIGAAVPGVVGTALRGVAGPLKRNAAEAAGDVIRQRSPLFKDIVSADAAAPYVQSSPGQRFLIRNAIAGTLLDRENDKVLDLRERGKR